MPVLTHAHPHKSYVLMLILIFSLSKGFCTFHYMLQMWWETPWLLLSFTTYLADAATDALTALLLLQAT